MFVVISRYTGTPNVFNCVNSIRAQHPKEEILVVDSASEDKSYFDGFKNVPNVIVADANNKHYSTGALQYAYDNYERDYYYLWQDSMELNANLDYCKNFKLSVWAYFSMVPYGLQEEAWAREQCAKYTAFTIPPIPYYDSWGIAGGIIFCPRETLDHLYSTGFKNILEDTKDKNQAMERMYGMAFTQLGYNIKENSLLGDWQSPSNMSIVTKHFLSRA